MAHDIHNEEYLECIRNRTNATAPEDNDSNLPTCISTDSQSELPFRYHHEPPVYSSPVSSPIFSLSPDEEISQPIPDGTRIFEQPSHSPRPMNCVVCGKLTSGAHSCPGCHGKIHVICGRTNGDEGYVTPIWVQDVISA